MEIQKIFSSWNEDERLYSVLMDEGEMYLFSDYLEQREFNSKAQKLLRRKWDIQQGLKKMKGVEKNADINELLREGRTGGERLLDVPNGPLKNLNQRINEMSTKRHGWTYNRTAESNYFKNRRYTKNPTSKYADHGDILGKYDISDYKMLTPPERHKEAFERIQKRYWERRE